MADRCLHRDDSYTVLVLRPLSVDTILAESLAVAAERSGLFDRIEVVSQPPQEDIPGVLSALTGRLVAFARDRALAAVPGLDAFDRVVVFQTLSGLANLVLLARWPGQRNALLEDGALHYVRMRRRPRAHPKDFLRWLRTRTGLCNDHADPFLLPLPPFDEIRASDPGRFDAVHAGEGSPHALPLWPEAGSHALVRFRTAVASAWVFDVHALSGALLVLGASFGDFGLDPSVLSEATVHVVEAFRTEISAGGPPPPLVYKPHPRERSPLLPDSDVVMEGFVPLEAVWMACPPEGAPAGVLALFPSTALEGIRSGFPSVHLAVVRFDGTGNPRYERSFLSAFSLVASEEPLRILAARVSHG
jgi:hypothetical protein